MFCSFGRASCKSGRLTCGQVHPSFCPTWTVPGSVLGTTCTSMSSVAANGLCGMRFGTRNVPSVVGIFTEHDVISVGVARLVPDDGADGQIRVNASSVAAGSTFGGRCSANRGKLARQVVPKLSFASAIDRAKTPSGGVVRRVDRGAGRRPSGRCRIRAHPLSTAFG